MANYLGLKPEKGKWYLSDAYKAEWGDERHSLYDGCHKTILAGPFDTKAEADKYKLGHPELQKHYDWQFK